MVGLAKVRVAELCVPVPLGTDHVSDPVVVVADAIEPLDANVCVAVAVLAGATL